MVDIKKKNQVFFFFFFLFENLLGEGTALTSLYITLVGAVITPSTLLCGTH
jgi:hypothetical protein